MLKVLRKTKNILTKSLKSFTNLKDYFYLQKLRDGDYKVLDSVRYYCQFASPELVEVILEKRILAQVDPRWQGFGFKTADEYAFWSWRACGIVCLKMIIDTFNGSDEKVRALLERGIELGGYVAYDKSGKLVDKGWYYKALINLAREYGFNGKIFSHLSIQSICREILSKHFVIASVDPGLIRGDRIESQYKGGHVVLVHGFKREDGHCVGFYLHNPSGKSEETRKAFISIEVFKKAFAERGFSVWK